MFLSILYFIFILHSFSSFIAPLHVPGYFFSKLFYLFPQTITLTLACLIHTFKIFFSSIFYFIFILCRFSSFITPLLFLGIILLKLFYIFPVSSACILSLPFLSCFIFSCFPYNLHSIIPFIPQVFIQVRDFLSFHAFQHYRSTNHSSSYHT